MLPILSGSTMQLRINVNMGILLACSICIGEQFEKSLVKIDKIQSRSINLLYFQKGECSLTPKVAKNDSKMAKVKKKMSAEYNHTQSLITV
jgi:hypothetical protein